LGGAFITPKNMKTLKIRETIRQLLQEHGVEQNLSPELNQFIKQLKLTEPGSVNELEGLLLHHTDRIVNQAFVAGWECARNPEKLLFETVEEEVDARLWAKIVTTRRPSSS
jgi:hypothetical protein